MKIRYRNLETSVTMELFNFDILKDMGASLIRNKNLKEDGTLTYNEEIDESIIEFEGETPEEELFILNNALETNKPLTVNDSLKLKARKRVAEEVGDIYDIVADVSKRLTMMERLTVRLTNDLITHAPEHIPVVNAAYADFIANYLAMQTTYSDVTSIADLEDPAVLFAKLFERSIKTTQIVKEDYLDKKETPPTE